jgi:hypothetical protein
MRCSRAGDHRKSDLSVKCKCEAGAHRALVAHASLPLRRHLEWPTRLGDTSVDLAGLGKMRREALRTLQDIAIDEIDL